MEKEKFLRKDISENEKYIGEDNTYETIQREPTEAEKVLGSMPKYEDLRKETMKSCGCIVIKNDKVLLVSIRNDYGATLWSFPKGHQKTGESYVEAALRETKEETGIIASILDENPITVNHLVHDGTTIKYIYLYLATTQTDTVNPQKDEIESAEWIPFEEAEDRLKTYHKQAWREATLRLQGK